MTRYLLSAEADKIQDLIFCSSRLREVVGASQLLDRFSREVPADLLQHYGGDTEDIIICDGGSFKILFDHPDKAISFGEHLSEVYRIATGSTLTVAKPVEINDPLDANFAKASLQAERNLREAKRKNKGWNSEEHMPFMAICTSCGTGLAKIYKQDESKHTYICSSCKNKNAETKQGNNIEFLNKFYELFSEKDSSFSDKYSWPGKGENDPTEDVANYDSNRYVAYLVADGNSMGKVFGNCQNRKAMIKLSYKLNSAICQALAKPTKAIMNGNEKKVGTDFIPVLPLILGGDELFALIPAPWALSFTLTFCRAFEEIMTKVYKEIKLSGMVPHPTISATVIICKNKHPYTLAYERARATLKKAKQLHRKIALYEKSYQSVINFEVVAGQQLTSTLPEGNFRPTLKPYLINTTLTRWGLPLQRLIDQRWCLRNMPSRRLHEFQKLYDPNSDNLSSLSQTEDMKLWQNRLAHLLGRIELRSENQATTVRSALQDLGDEKGWHQLQRMGDPWSGHGLPDLMDAWDYAFSLNRPIQEYREE